MNLESDESVELLKKRTQSVTDMLIAYRDLHPTKVHICGQLLLSIMWRWGWGMYKTKEDREAWLKDIEDAEQFLEEEAKKL